MNHNSNALATRRKPDLFRAIPILRAVKGMTFAEDEYTGELAQAKKKKLIDLPIPAVSEVADYKQFTRAGYSPPLPYIRRSTAREPDDAACLYAYDYDDEVWLAKNPVVGSSAPEGARLALASFEKIIDLLEGISGALGQGYTLTATDAVLQLPARLEMINEQNGPRFPLPTAVTPARIIEIVHKYWSDKRSKLKKPLLRRFWPQTSSTDPNPHHCFRPGDGEKRQNTRARTRKNDTESYQKLAQLSNELRGGLDLLQLVLSREEMKRDLLAVCTDAFDQGVYDAVDTSGVARQPATLHLRVGDQGPAVKVKLRLKGTGTFRNAAFGDAVGPGSSGDGDDADASWTSAAPRRHPKPGGRPSLKRDGVVPSGALRSTAARPHIKSGALLAGGVSSGIGGRKLELTKRRSGPAHGAAVGSGPVTHVSGYWHAGIRSDTALGSAFPTFCAGYRGFTLGPWAVPRTVLPHHLDQALLAFEDPLQLAFGLGMRLGVTATPSSLLANARGVINAVLPSRSQIFPMDMDYIVPDLPEVFRVDVSVQRRMLVSRKCLGLSAPGLSWEGHAGSGLVEGIGAGFSRDGRGWEDVGFHTGVDILPFDGEVGGDSTASLYGETPPADHSISRKRSHDSGVNDEADESRCLLRPRISRGGRLVVDRIPRTNGDYDLGRVGAAATQLAHRKRVRVVAQSHAWATVVDAQADAHGTDIEVSSGQRVTVSAAEIVCPPRMHLEHLYAYAGDPTDANVLHAHAFPSYSERVPSSSSTQTDDDVAAAGSVTCVKRGMSSALLAESAFARVGSCIAPPVLPASPDLVADAEETLLGFSRRFLPEGCGLPEVSELAACLENAIAVAEGSPLFPSDAACSLAFSHDRKAARVLGVSGAEGSVPLHALTAGLQSVFHGPRHTVPRQHESFAADRQQRALSGDSGDFTISGAWQPSPLPPTHMALSFSMPSHRFAEVWARDDSDSEDVAESLFSSCSADYGTSLGASKTSFLDAQARVFSAAVALSE